MVSRWTWGVQIKLWDPLRMRAIHEVWSHQVNKYTFTLNWQRTESSYFTELYRFFFNFSDLYAMTLTWNAKIIPLLYSTQRCLAKFSRYLRWLLRYDIYIRCICQHLMLAMALRLLPLCYPCDMSVTFYKVLDVSFWKMHTRIYPPEWCWIWRERDSYFTGICIFGILAIHMLRKWSNLWIKSVYVAE